MKVKRSMTLDIVVWSFMIVCMFGFLGVLAYTNSPRGNIGLHELIVLTYFLGFSVVYATIYLISLKGGSKNG